MAIEQLTPEREKQIEQLAVQLTRLPWDRLVADYDREVDCLYISFEKPQKATDSQMLDSGIIVRYKGEKIVGLTVLDASQR